MPPTITEILRTAPTITDIEALALSILKTLGLDATAWQKFAVPRTFFNLWTTIYLSSKRSIANGIVSRLVKGNAGDALTDVARRFFELDRDEALPTVGEVLIEDNGGAPIDLLVGDITIEDEGTGKRYRNITAGSLGSGGSLPISFCAEQTGSSYNIQAHARLEIVEGPTGLLASNPPVAGSDTWITSSGTDAQTDESLITECHARWDTAPTDDERYARAIAKVVPLVTKVKVFHNLPGTLEFLLATDTGVATAEQITAAEVVIHRVRPGGLRSVVVRPPSPYAIAVVATVYVKTAHAGAYLPAIEVLRAAYQKELKSGDDVYLSRLHAILHAPAGVARVDMTFPAIALDGSTDYDAMAVLDFSGVTVQAVL